MSARLEADAAFDRGEFASAAVRYAECFDRDSDDRHCGFRHGLARFRMKDFAAARRAFEAVVLRHPEDAPAWYYLGLSAERSGDEPGALRGYRMAARIDPTLIQARHKIGAFDRAPERIMAPPTPAPDVAASAPTSARLRLVDPPPVANETQPEISDPDSGHPGEILHISKRRRLGSFTHHILLIIGGTPVLVLAVSFAFEILQGGIRRGDEPLIFIPGLIFAGAVFVHLLLSVFLTRFTIYERRLDITDGVLFRRHRSVWYFRITDLTYRRNPITLLTRNATIKLETEQGPVKITGLVPPRGVGPVRYMSQLFDALRTSVRSQRGQIKRIFT